MLFVDGVRRSFAGKDAGSPDSSRYRDDRGHSMRATGVTRRHNRCFAKPS